MPTWPWERNRPPQRKSGGSGFANPQLGYVYVEPVPNATARNWGGTQGRAPGMSGSLNARNMGADYLAPLRSPLYTPVGGRVVQVFNSKYDGTEQTPGARERAVNENHGWGTSIVLEGEDGYYHRLSHLVPNSPTVKEGDFIPAGQQIGLVGQSGNTVGNGINGGAPHLDWEKYTTKSGNPLGTDREYVDPRNSEFRRDGQVARQPGMAQQQAPPGGLNRQALSPQMQQWAPLIEEKAAKYGIPANLLAGIVDYESGGNPNAGHPTSGATGLGQVMPRGSGRGFENRPTREELLNPETNLEWSAKILAANYNRYDKNPQSAAAAYLGAVDAKGNPTTAADANGTNGFKYVQEVMGRAERFAGAGAGADTTGSGPSPEQQEREVDQQMALTTKSLIEEFQTQREGIKKRIGEQETTVSGLQEDYNKKLAKQAEIMAKTDQKAEDKKLLGALVMELPALEAQLKEAKATLQASRTDLETNDAMLSKNLEIIAGKPLAPEEKANLEANARQSDAQAKQAEAQAALLKPGEPGYEEAKQKAALLRAQAENYKRTIDIDQQRADADTYAAQTGRYTAETGRYGALTDRMKAETDIWATRETTPSVIERNYASAGLDTAQATRLMERLSRELADLEADTALKGDQAAYTRAQAARINNVLAEEKNELLQKGRLTQAQADELFATLPSRIAMAEENVRGQQAETGLRQGQTWAQMVQANALQFDTQMKALEAETWKNVQRVASDPNASDEDIIGAIQAGARNATEAANVYQTKLNQFQQEEAARHNKVAEGIAIQQADEQERSNRYSNLADIQNSRANMQNASTNAIGPRLGATGMANAMAGLGMVVGSKGLDRLAMRSGTGASVVNPVKEGLAPFEKDQETLRAGVRENRLADPNAKGTAFQPPRATAGTAGIAQQRLPNYSPIAIPTVQGVNFKAPAPALAAPATAAAAPQAAPAPAMPPPTPALPVPEEEEEEVPAGGGGGRKITFRFTPPKAKREQSTAVASGGGGKTTRHRGTGFRVPVKVAA